MPLVPTTYSPSFPFRSGHVNTIYPVFFRWVSGVTYQRERIETPDDDFFDLDWVLNGQEREVLVLHGLESSAEAVYVKGMLKAFSEAGWDGVGMNFRSCSGERNRQPGAYHAGQTTDITQAVNHIASKGRYKSMMLIGFSLGGNVVLNYLGREPEKVNPLVSRAMAISTPVDLSGSADQLDKNPENRYYVRRFLKRLNAKALDIAARAPGLIDENIIASIKTIRDFDHHITAQINGFDGADDYYTRSSSKPHLANIRIPTYLLNANDDSFLGTTSFPTAEAQDHPNLYFEHANYGGHVGFVDGKRSYAEQRALAFAQAA